MLRLSIIWISFIIVSLIFVSAGHAKIDMETAVGIWLFDEGHGDTVRDYSGNGNDGKLMNGPEWVEGKFDKALEFDGIDDYVQVPHSDSLTMTNEITIAFWFRTGKKMNVFDDRQAIVGKHYLEYEVGIYPSGMIHTYTSNGAGGYDEGINTSNVEKTWNLDEWYHLAWTLSGTIETVYVNGGKVGEFNKPNKGTQPGTHALEIGRRVGGTLEFEGAVDDVALFNSALEEKELQTIMNQGLLTILGGGNTISPSGKLASTWAKIKK